MKDVLKLIENLIFWIVWLFIIGVAVNYWLYG